MLHELYHGLARFITGFSYRGIISILMLTSSNQCNQSKSIALNFLLIVLPERAP
jgi:hypothetical protein